MRLKITNSIIIIIINSRSKNENMAPASNPMDGYMDIMFHMILKDGIVNFSVNISKFHLIVNYYYKSNMKIAVNN